MTSRNLSFIFLIVAAIQGCAPERNNMMSNSYHNTTAHYNAFFMADEYIKEVEGLIESGHDWNYNLVLPVFPPFDSAISGSYTAQIEDCIEKASLAIQRHKGSKWEDNAYVLVGKARFYSLDYVNAIETFKYVNTKGKDDKSKHEALVALMRTFIEYNEFNNAIAVSDYLKKEKLSKVNLKNLYLTRGYLYQKSEDLDNMVQNLIQAEPLITNLKERARINFIIGQVYQSLALDGEAYNYYRKTLKSNPLYELSFYTKLNMAQVTQLAKKDDAKKIRKYFKKLLKDRKNEEFKDKIYYEMANFEIRNNDLDLGIALFNKSIRASKVNKRQQGHSYWSLGKIYYDSLANYKLAKLYYDSTLSVLPNDEKEYVHIEKRQKILEHFVAQLTIIQENDSLINLTMLSQDSLTSFLNDYIEKKETEEKLKRKADKDKARNAARLAANSSNGVFDQNQKAIGSNNYEGNVWYFYNESVVARGVNEFNRIWGDRALEDNWRLKNKSSSISNEQPEGGLADSKQENEESKVEEEEEFKIDISELLATLPDSDEKKAVLLAEIEEATYQLGNIFNFDLNEKDNATDTFEGFHHRFTASEYRNEVMYLLYIIFKEVDNIPKSEFYKNLILKEAPESIYAKIIVNPNYRAESQAAVEKLKRIYASAYEFYRNGAFKESLNLINDGLREYPDNEFTDNMTLLKILVHGKSESIYKYQYELNNFITTFESSELIPYVDSLVTASEQYQINLVNSTKAKFIENFEKPHFFIFVYETDQELSDALPLYFQTLIDESSLLTIGNLILDQSHSMILISEFESKELAKTFNSKVESENTEEKINKSGVFSNFVITKENFNILYQTRELDSYLKFYRKHYQQ